MYLPKQFPEIEGNNLICGGKSWFTIPTPHWGWVGLGCGQFTKECFARNPLKCLDLHRKFKFPALTTYRGVGVNLQENLYRSGQFFQFLEKFFLIEKRNFFYSHLVVSFNS